MPKNKKVKKFKKETFVKSVKEVKRLIKSLKSNNIKDWRLYRIKYNCEICGKECTILRFRYEHKERKLCKKHTLIENLGGEKEYKKYCKKKTKKACNTQIDRYGGIGNQNELANEKRMETIKERYGEDYYSNMFKESYKQKTEEEINEINEKRRATNLERYNTENPYHGVLYLVDDIYFDSSYEIFFYLYYRDNKLHIIREPCAIEYWIKNIKHKYYPDFETDDGLIEIKSNYIWSKTSKEKRKCIKENKIIVLKNKEIKFYKDYCINKYGNKFWLEYRV